MSSTPCRHGTACMRPDCWFSHPQGRVIDNTASGSAAGGYSGSVARAGPSSGGSASGGGQTACRFGRQCHRENCYFSHPQGRDIDERPPAGALSAGPGASSSPFDPNEWCGPEDELDEEALQAQLAASACECCGGKPFECQTSSCKEMGRCGCTMGDEIEDELEEEAEDGYRDEWFPASRDCPCCHGTIYRCEKQQSECAGGECFCSVQRTREEMKAQVAAQ